MKGFEVQAKKKESYGSRKLLFAGYLLAQNLPLSESFAPSRHLPTHPSHRQRQRSSSPELSSLTSSTQRAYASVSAKPRRQHVRKWDRMTADLAAFRQAHGHTMVSAANVRENEQWAALYRWTLSVRQNYSHQILDYRPRRSRTSGSGATPRHQLPPEKLAQLQALEFCWDIQAVQWDRRYSELVAFYREHGHSSVPANYPKGLGIFVRNCRREYRRLEQGEPSTLTVDRLNRLFAVNFKWNRSREEAWEHRYQQLKDYYQEHGHSNVPMHYPDNMALGMWCTNQRTFYSRLRRGETTSLTGDRMQLLEDVSFVWNSHQRQFDSMLNRLATYYQEHGHVKIPTYDANNRDLRLWTTLQRYYYHRRQRPERIANAVGDRTSVPLTDERIEAIESAIPDFAWRARGSLNGGPSSKDWGLLFDEMRKKGLQPGMPAKQHWFDGVNPFTDDVKKTWTEDDLLALWNEDGDDGEDIGEDWEAGEDIGEEEEVFPENP